MHALHASHATVPSKPLQWRVMQVLSRGAAGYSRIPSQGVGELRPHFPDIARAPGWIRAARASSTMSELRLVHDQLRVVMMSGASSR